jgi:CheY-like chemotaxis protein
MVDATTKVEIPELVGRVLVVEDNKINQELMSLLLNKAGLEVLLASNGQEAIDKAQNDSVDLILMDLLMPVMGGLDATRELRVKGFSKPIIALTGSIMEEDRDRCFSAGCNGFLSKPVDRQHLYKVLSEHLGNTAEVDIVQKLDIKTNENNKTDDVSIKSELSDDPDYAVIVENFIKSLFMMQREIDHALKEKDWMKLDELFHQLKGSGGGMGFPMITEVASEIGILIKEQAYGQAQSEIEKFNLICSQVYAGADSNILDKAM